MNRKALEKKIVKALLEKNVDFELINEDFSSKFNHIITFGQKNEGLTYVISLRFMKPNYLKLQVQFFTFSDRVNKELSEFINYSHDLGFSIVNLDMNDYNHYVHSKNQKDFYIDDVRGLSSVDVEAVANKITQRYFSVFRSDLIYKLGSLNEICGLINSTGNINEGKLKLSIYCFLGPFQIIGGSVCALLLRSEGYRSTVKTYWNYSLTKFQKGDDKYIDGFWQYMRECHTELISDF